MMKLIAQNDIDRAKWDELVENQPKTLLYHQSLFLDPLAEKWMLLVDENYSCGIPLPYVVRLGKKGLYTPNFIRAIDWLGVKPNDFELKKIKEIILKEFDYGNILLESKVFEYAKSDRVYQLLTEPFKLNDQAKRSIKKFEKSNFKIIMPELNQILNIILDDLKVKVTDLKMTDFERFKNLFSQYPKEKIWSIGVEENNQIVGGMIFIYWQNTLHYVKGGCFENAKNKGSMYAMMLKAIEHAEEKKLILDFGGSNVDGVRRFNLAFGATDKSYFRWSFDNSPWWFKAAKKLKNRLKK